LLEAGVVLLWLFLCSVVAGFIGIATTVQKYILFEGCEKKDSILFGG